MRSLARGIQLRPLAACALAASLAASLALAGCERTAEAPQPVEAESVGADREAQLAAEQLAALGGPADAATRARYTGDFQASGSLDALGSGEGAWELRLLEEYASFSRPGLGQDGGIPGERLYRENGMQVTAGPVTATLRAEACALPNGASLPYTAHVLFEGVVYQGCARRGVDEGERATWASVLPELLPAIDVCLSRVSSRPARVTMASALDDSVVSVRIRENDGARHECIAAADGSEVTAFQTIADIDRRAGEGEVEFLRVRDQPAAERCRTPEQALDLNGEPAGWLLRRTC